jgi:ankyrin repeat protein
MSGDSVEEAFFADKRFKTDGTLDENKIRRYILSCMSALLSLQQKRDSIGKVESRLFFRALSAIGGAFSSDGRSADDLIADKKDLISGFMIRSYLNVESTKLPGDDSVWYKEHWACLLGSESGLYEDELKDMLSESPTALTTATVAIPACHLAVAATKLYSSLEFLHQETMERYCPRLAYLTDANGETAIHYAARYSRSADVLEWILGLNPSAVKATSKDRKETPLHHLVSRRRCFLEQMSMLRQLLDADVSAALVQDSSGNTPLHLLCNLGAKDDEVKKASFMAMRRELLTACPAAASIANSNGSLPLHCVYSGDSDISFLQQLIAAYSEGLKCGDKKDLLPAHLAAELGTLEMLTVVLDAYPEAVSSSVAYYGTPLHRAARRSDAAGPHIVRYLYDIYPAAIKTPSSERGWYPLHDVSFCGSYEVLKLVHSLYPEAISIATTDDLQLLPLHVLMFVREFKSPLSDEADMLRYLLRHYPAAVTIPAGPGYMNVYEMALYDRNRGFVRRLILRAAPELDPDELHRLNYAERRMALFLAHCAISKNDDHSSSSTNGGSSFVLRLRALARRNMGELFHEIVSFL